MTQPPSFAYSRQAVRTRGSHSLPSIGGAHRPPPLHSPPPRGRGPPSGPTTRPPSSPSSPPSGPPHPEQGTTGWVWNPLCPPLCMPSPCPHGGGGEVVDQLSCIDLLRKLVSRVELAYVLVKYVNRVPYLPGCNQLGEHRGSGLFFIRPSSLFGITQNEFSRQAKSRYATTYTICPPFAFIRVKPYHTTTPHHLHPLSGPVLGPGGRPPHGPVAPGPPPTHRARRRPHRQGRRRCRYVSHHPTPHVFRHCTFES